MTVNIPKNQNRCFSTGGKLAHDTRFYFSGQEIEIVNSLNYLGVRFSCGGSFMQNAKFLSEMALKAMHALFQIVKDVETPINIMVHLFDSLVASFLNYGCESWGILNAECIERIHRKFLKYILHVKISTNNYAVYKEMGRYPLIIERQLLRTSNAKT